ncbi:hypothetical protein ASD56_05365 [Microbacterium sp. Root166]|uniref:hypothetical protein n=1 Tax=Microbacterium sp. Root166 TaxID=1736478 RepID=UPI0006FDA956|nr:hypothetical protein [Microbacterium sp. Root166]KQZ85722.1 hypothetical protein ASD56_05365 [Microbacterium sp. Root166]
MTRFTIDAPTLLRLIRDDAEPASGHSLVGPAALRSDVLTLLYAEVRAGTLDEPTAREQLEKLASVKIRLLGDRVSRAVAFTLARQLDLDEIGPAEYLAVASLQSDALITDDPALQSAADGIVSLARYEDLVS